MMLCFPPNRTVACLCHNNLLLVSSPKLCTFVSTVVQPSQCTPTRPNQNVPHAECAFQQSMPLRYFLPSVPSLFGLYCLPPFSHLLRSRHLPTASRLSHNSRSVVPHQLKLLQLRPQCRCVFVPSFLTPLPCLHMCLDPNVFCAYGIAPH